MFMRAATVLHFDLQYYLHPRVHVNKHLLTTKFKIINIRAICQHLDEF